MLKVENSFVAALKRIKDVDERDLLAKMNELFAEITKFSANDAVAAYQALSLTEAILEGKKGEKVTKHFKNAIAVQMLNLANQADSATEQVNLRTRFKAVIGRALPY